MRMGLNVHITTDDGSAGDSDDENANGDLARSDYQLYEALNMLKGLSILQERMQ